MDKKKTIFITLFALIGLVLTVELTLIFFKVNFNDSYSASFCSVNNLIDCDGVAKTNYSLFLGIPLSLWGMFFYTLTLFLNYVHLIQNRFKNLCLKLGKNNNALYGALTIAASKGILRPTFTMMDKKQERKSQRFSALCSSCAWPSHSGLPFSKAIMTPPLSLPLYPEALCCLISTAFSIPQALSDKLSAC